MPTVEINGQKSQAFVEETLLAVGRREKSHIGYACGGNGLCQTCDVVVHEGGELLSEPNEVEKAWNPQKKLDDGHRLACQARVMKEGTVTLTTRPEKTKMLYEEAFGMAGEDGKKHTNMAAIGELMAFIGIETVEHTVRMPFVFMNAFQRISAGELTEQANQDIQEAWKERMPEIQELMSKSTFGVSDSLTPLLGSLTATVQNLFGSLTGMFGGGNPQTAEASSEGTAYTVQDLPIELGKKA
ncbi:ferredoxin [Chloroherpeton thalassium ATCC 35110]|uniref:Ferredoxin n=1 Tax=Chloroherpeton thalassium (strain ATCC 35110 / GB-78) TaxID=517418 RepID=B3QZ29_CHLT3|nr:2Fe-2S iron-sulfur cluster-binding protein [Chloroherpeton thalassium]ACF13722.1 ferredoxin [Chloroherpeton thalassium ATCC 35110]